MSWIEAQGECEILGGFLAEVKTEGEHEFLKGVTGLLEVRQDVLKYLNGSLTAAIFKMNLMNLIIHFRNSLVDCDGG